MINKMSAKLSFILVALLAAIGMSVIGCGQMSDSPTDGIISGGDDEISGKTPEIAIVKTITTKAGTTEISYHFESDMDLEMSIVVGLEVRTGDNTEGAIVILQKDTSVSEAFSFGDHISQVTILQHKDLLDFKSTVAAINEADMSVDFTQYPVHQRPYNVNTENSSVSR